MKTMKGTGKSAANLAYPFTSKELTFSTKYKSTVPGVLTELDRIYRFNEGVVGVYTFEGTMEGDKGGRG